jgi:hypothetical protein
MWYSCSNSDLMKPPLTLIVAIAASFSCMAQAQADSAARADSILHTRIRAVPFVDAIDAVLGDLPNNLRQVTGELLLAEGETDNYVSLVVVPGARNCMVTRYHSVEDTTASWQAKMFIGGDFGAASRRYQQLFQQLKVCYVRLPDSSIYYLDGAWQPAREGVTFTTSTLKLKTDDQRFRDVEVELELVYELADWAVNINIVTKKPDDEVGMGGGN